MTRTTETSHKTYWLEHLKHQGISPHHPEAGTYPVWRNVKDYGAVGDGRHDDTEAINNAIKHGGRCGGGLDGHDSSTIAPAVVYFPKGVYKVTRPIISYYNTSIIGDATDRPTLQADASFQGLAVIDENPYEAYGRNWYTPQNNFFRSVAHLVIDTTNVKPHTECSGIHHQVSQATGLRNVHFAMRPYSPSSGDVGQIGIRMENASGGYLNGCSAIGGKIAFWLGNQQFTIQDCHIKECYIAISQHWNWTFVYHKIKIDHCTTAFEMRVTGQENQQAATSVACMDWDISYCGYAFQIVGEEKSAQGSLVLSNVAIQHTENHVTRALRNWEDKSFDKNVTTLLAPANADGQRQILNWTWQGDQSEEKQGASCTGPLTLSRPRDMIDSKGHWHYKPRPEYLSTPSTSFISVKDHGAVGDGVADDTKALQNILNCFSDGQHVIFIPHGHYLLTDTLTIPPGARIVGEIWPVLLGSGSNFNDEDNPRPVMQVGHHSGQEGLVEISECIVSTRGPTRGAIVLQWNLQKDQRCTSTGSFPGMWDTHIRLGGFKGSQLEDDRFDCDKPLDIESSWACFLAWYLPRGSNGCFVNNWIWLADHTLDSNFSTKRYAGKQISLLASRGILIESNPGPVMLWGGASEHFLLYQYQLYQAENIFIGHVQTESPYFLGEGIALPTELTRVRTEWNDPQWKSKNAYTQRSWGIRIVNSDQVHIYGAGLYSFFDAYKQDKLHDRKCQENILFIQNDKKSIIVVVNLNTIGVTNMLNYHDCRKDEEEEDDLVIIGSQASRQQTILEKDHQRGFTSLLGYWLLS
ncbi:unnamed protein product [Sympodiomycopsis kandeliae]